MKSIVRCSLLFAGLMGASAPAFSLPLAPEMTSVAEAPVRISSEDLEGHVNFTAIVALDNCSGSLVRFEESQESEHAMVMTNGHCYEGGFLANGLAIADKVSRRSFSLLDSKGRETIATLKASQILYGTMTGTDVLLYQLESTYGEIEENYGVTALLLSPHRALEGDPIRIVSGYWKRTYTCEIDTFIHEMREADWVWKDSIRYTQPGCKTIGGTSGSPIINTDTYEVIGINNTGNEDGERCTMNNPCEVDESGNVVVNHGASYGQQIYGIYSCLDADRNFDFTIDGCQLTQPEKKLEESLDSETKALLSGLAN